jgi:hypothetical protein
LEVFSGLWRGRRQVAGNHQVRKSRAGVAAVAEWLVGRLSAAAKTNRGAAGKAESGTGWIDNFEIALDAQGTITVANDLRGWHEKRVTGK